MTERYQSQERLLQSSFHGKKSGKKREEVLVSSRWGLHMKGKKKPKGAWSKSLGYDQLGEAREGGEVDLSTSSLCTKLRQATGNWRGFPSGGGCKKVPHERELVRVSIQEGGKRGKGSDDDSYFRGERVRQGKVGRRGPIFPS